MNDNNEYSEEKPKKKSLQSKIDRILYEIEVKEVQKITEEFLKPICPTQNSMNTDVIGTKMRGIYPKFIFWW